MLRDRQSRRQFLAALTATGIAGVAFPNLSARNHAQGAELVPTPACGDDDDEPTLAQTEGPFFAPSSPERSVLREPEMRGTPIVFAGLVVTRSCRPIAGALVDLWHADDAGNYDNEGYRWRGHQYTNAQGGFRFETIVPGLYPGRTRHFHVKYQAPNHPVLTTQHYFPGEPQNERDGIFRPELLLNILDQPEIAGSFTTVLDIP